MIEFLTCLFSEGLGYSGLCTARSAVSTVANFGKDNIGNHMLVKRFTKGVFVNRPALARHNVTWDPSTVIQYLKTMDTTGLLSIGKKLVTLFALLSGQRGQTLHLLDTRNLTVGSHFVKVRIGDIIKHSKPGKHIYK